MTGAWSRVGRHGRAVRLSGPGPGGAALLPDYSPPADVFGLFRLALRGSPEGDWPVASKASPCSRFPGRTRIRRARKRTCGATWRVLAADCIQSPEAPTRHSPGVAPAAAWTCGLPPAHKVLPQEPHAIAARLSATGRRETFRSRALQNRTRAECETTWRHVRTRLSLPRSPAHQWKRRSFLLRGLSCKTRSLPNDLCQHFYMKRPMLRLDIGLLWACGASGRGYLPYIC